MKTIIHKATERGTANYGWLKANYYFSFANYYNQEKINFGALRVLNDDYIKGGMGFGEHPHNNMEIITIPLKGSLKHKDSMSNKWIELNVGEVQVMSAGSGLRHSEMNNLLDEELNLFQIWIIPNKENVTPKYDQKFFEPNERKNNLQILVSSIDNPIENSMQIHQNAVISRIDLDENYSFTYRPQSTKNGVYIVVVDGEIDVNSNVLQKRDAIGIYNSENFVIHSKKETQLLFIEIPMEF